MYKRTDWGDIVPTIVREREMGFLVGNGFSRLCGAPSWSDLFSARDVIEVLEREGVDRHTSYLELGYLLAKRAPVTWDRVLRRLYDWGQSAADRESHAHRALLQLLRPRKPSPPHVAILTTNVDPLLEHYGYRRDHIGYLHGEPHSRESWIFTADEYWDAWNRDQGLRRIFKNFKAEGVLFLGYGHSHEDFDLVQTVIELRRHYFGRMFTLLSREEASRGEVRCRLDWQGVAIVTYDLPVDPTSAERELFLTRALLDLAEECAFDREPECAQAYQSLQEWCDLELSRRSHRRARATVVLGLAGVNRHAALPSAIPSSERRVAESATIRVEPGGPGFIVSQIGRFTGMDSYLVTKVASDEPGNLVRHVIAKQPAMIEARIFTDFVDIVPRGPGDDGFATWDSFVLEPSDGLSHRVFIDRAVDARLLDLSDATRHAVASMLRDGADRVFYFDRHYRDSIVYVLRSVNYVPISDGVWTVYETDSDGGRYGPGASYSKANAYEFEKRLAADELQCINVVAASFRFARDCLAVHYGHMSRAEYESLISIHDTPEIIGNSRPSCTEDQVIAKLVQNEDRLEAFAAAVRKGADRFLRQHALRLVVVTLHRHGALAITVPVAGTGDPVLRYVPGSPLEAKRIYTASAGDVFRGALVAALTRARDQGLTAEDVMEPSCLASIIELCNRCAAAKVLAPTLNDCLPEIRRVFHQWIERLPQRGSTMS
jgi:sugar/nucleoside kinase (ribokinase family)